MLRNISEDELAKLMGYIAAGIEEATDLVMSKVAELVVLYWTDAQGFHDAFEALKCAPTAKLALIEAMEEGGRPSAEELEGLSWERVKPKGG